WMILAQEGTDDQQPVQLVDRRHRHAEERCTGTPAVSTELGLAPAKIDVFAGEATQQTCQQEKLLERTSRRRKCADLLRTMLVFPTSQSARDEVDRFAPIDFAPLSTLLEHRTLQAIRRVQALIREAVAVRQPALVDLIVLQWKHAQDALILHLDD